MATRDTLWPYERAQRLKTFFAMGKGDAEIAHFLGVSKGAVIGKRQRFGLLRTRRYGPRKATSQTAPMISSQPIPPNSSA